jgi:PQQ-dependent dehydrogenase (methanol/ethanol family)
MLGVRRFFLSAVSVAVLGYSTWVAAQGRRVEESVLQHAHRTGLEWVSYNGGWTEQRYSPLMGINSSNVAKLGLAWRVEIPSAGGNQTNRHEATPLYFDGLIYSIAPWSVVYAVDARTGKIVWSQNPDVNQQLWASRICCGVVNRGLALYEDKVIAPVVDGRLRAYDAKTGRIVWETRVTDVRFPYTITMAPRVIKGGRVIVGVSGGEYGLRGYFDAYDANTGQRVWRFWTVPGPPTQPYEQPILEQWAKTWSPDFWKLGIGGGGPVWGSVAYDEESDIVYVGTGQPASWSDYHRGKGDALCTNCILAVRGATGEYIWHYQTTPGDNWDFDSIADIVLADLTIGGRKRQVLMHAPKNGFFYVLDRKTGELLSAEPWVTVNWATGVNLKTGRPTINPEAFYETEAINILPWPGGGHVWPPMSFNPNTGLVYIPGTIGRGYVFQANPDFKPTNPEIGPEGRGVFIMGTGRGNAAGAAKGKQPVPSPPSIGPRGQGDIVSAWDPVTNTEKWRGLSAGFNQGGTLAMGDIVLSSVNNRLLAYHAETGEKLLELPTGLSMAGPPVTFMVDDKQYVVLAGGPPQGASSGAAGAGAAKGGPAPVTGPSHMIALVVGGTTPLPGAEQ